MDAHFSKVAGFGMLQAMVGVAVLGILSLVFVRKSANRHEISIAIKLVSYRDQVLDYYTALASNRVSWRNTRRAVTNWNALSSGSGIDIRDVDNVVKIKAGGLLLPDTDITNGNILPLSIEACPTTDPINDTHFCVRAKKGSTPNSINISIEYRQEGRTIAQMANYLVASKEREVNFGGATTVGTDCGKKAIVNLDFATKTVTCSDDPLIEPPCYRGCATSQQGKCPHPVGGGKESVTGFINVPNRHARTQCSGQGNILLAKSSLPVNNGIASISRKGELTTIGNHFDRSTNN